MTILHYIDNEVPAFGEWDGAPVEIGSSTLVRSFNAAFPERGTYGLRVTIVGGDVAYVTKTTTLELDPAGGIYIGTWLNMAALPSGWCRIIRVLSGGTILGFVYLYSNGTMRLRIYDDAAGLTYSDYSSALAAGRWNYVVIRLLRASSDVAADGGGAIWVNGQPDVTLDTIDNYDRVSGAISFRMGVPAYAQDGFIIDYDETKVATEYPEPYVPTPATVYPDDPDRTVVLYWDHNDPIEFAEYCVDQLNIPRCNLIRLPNADPTESLATVGSYDTKVADDIAAYFALNPTVAANCTTFLLGYKMAGYFTEAGTLHSITSRLMRYGQAFSSKFDNPLYSPSTVERLTVSILRANNMYCCTRIDADTLQHAKDLVDRGLNIRDDPGDTLRPVPTYDFFCSDDASLLASLPIQHLRMLTYQYTAEYTAFTVGDDIAAMSEPGSAGMLAVVIETATNAQTSIRSDISEMTKGLLTTGYACGVGWSALPADGFDGDAFFEMLRIGGSFAEAVAVSGEHLDWTSHAVGLASMTVAFELGGYDLYHGFGGLEGVNWSNPIAYARPGSQQLAVNLDLPTGRRNVLAVRTVSSAGIEDASPGAVAYVQTDSQGALLPAPLPVPTDVTAALQANGDISVGFSCRRLAGMAEPDSFQVLTDGGSGVLDLVNPAGAISVSDNRQTEFVIAVAAETLPAIFAVRASKAASNGPVSRLVTVRPAETPAPPIVL